MRVVLDTNVFVSAAIQTGPPYRVVQRWLKHREFYVIICPMLLAEVADVLMERPHLRRRIELAAARRYVATLNDMADLAPDPVDVEPATRDADDDYLVALARAHNADFIVTGDKDLLEWEGQQPPVITPAVFDSMLDAGR